MPRSQRPDRPVATLDSASASPPGFWPLFLVVFQAGFAAWTLLNFTDLHASLVGEQGLWRLRSGVPTVWFITRLAGWAAVTAYVLQIGMPILGLWRTVEGSPRVLWLWQAYFTALIGLTVVDLVASEGLRLVWGTETLASARIEERRLARIVTIVASVACSVLVGTRDFAAFVDSKAATARPARDAPTPRTSWIRWRWVASLLFLPGFVLASAFYASADLQPLPSLTSPPTTRTAVQQLLEQRCPRDRSDFVCLQAVPRNADDTSKGVYPMPRREAVGLAEVEGLDEIVIRFGYQFVGKRWQWHTIRLTTGDGSELVPGVYERPNWGRRAEAPHESTIPVLDIGFAREVRPFTMPPNCRRPTGRFDVLELTRDPRTRQIRTTRIRLEQECLDTPDDYLFGEICVGCPGRPTQTSWAGPLELGEQGLWIQDTERLGSAALSTTEPATVDPAWEMLFDVPTFDQFLTLCPHDDGSYYCILASSDCSRRHEPQRDVVRMKRPTGKTLRLLEGVDGSIEVLRSSTVSILRPGEDRLVKLIPPAG
ncbi:MAG: hypothetical protein AAGE94_07185, partial [Acidobacteriota bacterium]